MRVKSINGIMSVLGALLMALMLAPAAIAGNNDPHADVSASGVVVSLTAGDSLSLRVVGPEGAVLDRHTSGSQLSWSVSGAPNGNYRFEALAKRQVDTNDVAMRSMKPSAGRRAASACNPARSERDRSGVH